MWLALACLLPACGSCSDARSSDKAAAVTLRLRPEHRQTYREHWIYDLETPGTGIVRRAMSFDVAVSRAEPAGAGVRLRHVLRREYHSRDGRTESRPRSIGAVVNSQWSSDRSLVGEIGVEAKDLQLAAAMRSAFAAARFGMLIEYPDQAVAVGDSWSIEPRVLPVGPGLEATLRPSFTLERIREDEGRAREVGIAADIQVDLSPVQVGEGVVVEGGGTASAQLRVSAGDGLLLDARTVLHFNQEIVVQGSDVLGYREFSASAHVFTDDDHREPNLAAEPLQLEPADADEQHACASVLASAAERVGRSPAHSGLYLVGALHAPTLPQAHGGAPIREGGVSLVLGSDTRRVELDGTPIETREIARNLHAASVLDEPLYVYADASLPLERMRAVLAFVPRSSPLRLIVRDAGGSTPPPKPPRWLEEQLRLALSAPAPPERQRRLEQLLLDHLALCDAAAGAFQRARDSRQGFEDLPAQIVSAFAKCGCTTTNLDGLEALLYVLFGSPDLRSLRLPRRFDDVKLAAAATTGDLARSLDRGVQ